MYTIADKLNDKRTNIYCSTAMSNEYSYQYWKDLVTYNPTKLDIIGRSDYNVGAARDEINGAYDEINGAYDEINGAYDEINGAYDEINGAYDEINGAYDEINGAYDEINGDYDEIYNAIVIGDDIDEPVHTPPSRVDSRLLSLFDGMEISDAAHEVKNKRQKTQRGPYKHNDKHNDIHHGGHTDSYGGSEDCDISDEILPYCPQSSESSDESSTSDTEEIGAPDTDITYSMLEE
jgi:hypothetical protein